MALQGFGGSVAFQGASMALQGFGPMLGSMPKPCIMSFMQVLTTAFFESMGKRQQTIIFLMPSWTLLSVTES